MTEMDEILAEIPVELFDGYLQCEVGNCGHIERYFHPLVGLLKMADHLEDEHAIPEAKIAEEIGVDHDQEKVHCPECDTEVFTDTMEDALDTAETHDEKQHDGERTTLVNGILPPSDETAEAARETVEELKERGVFEADGE